MDISPAEILPYFSLFVLFMLRIMGSNMTEKDRKDRISIFPRKIGIVLQPCLYVSSFPLYQQENVILAW